VAALLVLEQELKLAYCQNKRIENAKE
jgi:hypothetical protein